jgi:DNA-binding transcriptional MerR regulator
MREQVIMAATEDGWAPRSDVAALVGVSVSALRRWIEAGDVRAERRGSVWFVSVEDAERRAGKYEAEEAPEGGGPAAQLLFQATAHLKQAHRHVETLQGPAEKLLAMLAEENQRLRARCAQLEQRHLDMLGVYERSMTLEHERKLSEIAMNASEQRKQEAFRTLVRYAPVVATMVASHVSGGAAAPVREGALAQLVAELSDEQVQAIAASGVLPSHAAALLVEVRKQVRDGQKQSTQEGVSSAAS